MTTFAEQTAIPRVERLIEQADERCLIDAHAYNDRLSRAAGADEAGVEATETVQDIASELEAVLENEE